MSIPISQKVDLLYKQAFGVTKTDTEANKSPSNESIASPLLNRGDTLWSQSDQIPGVAASTAGLVQAYTGSGAQECVADNTTVPIGGVYPTWKTSLTYWIPAEFGSTYSVSVWVDDSGAADPTSTGTQIFGAGSGGTGEFFYNYQSGVLNFIGETIPTALTSSKVLYIVGYRYIGLTGVTSLPDGTQIGNLVISDQTVTGQNANANIVFTANGSGQVVTSGNITASYFYGNGAFLSGIDTSGIANGTSNVSIPLVNGNINLNVNGILTANITDSGIVATGTGSFTGNLSGANLNTSGVVSATGNISGGNLTSGGVVEVTGNVIGGNLTTVGLVSATGNVSGGNITTGGVVDATGNVSGANLTSGGVVEVTGNVIGGNITTGGVVDATGNVSGANLTSGGVVEVTGNVIGGNITTVGLVSATGNVSGGNITTAGVVDATGNVSGGNITTAGVVDATGNVSGANLTSGGVVEVTGNVIGGNLTTVGLVSATGNVSGGNITTAGVVTATGNVSGGNLTTAGNIDTTAGIFNGDGYGISNIAAGNIVGLSLSSISNGTSNVNIATVDGNITLSVDSVGNVAVITATGLEVAGTAGISGTVTAPAFTANTGLFSGNGAGLTNLVGANVTGAVAFATTANSVAGANVSGQVGNALVSGTVYTAAQPNITSVGTLTSITSSGDANIAGVVNVGASEISTIGAESVTTTAITSEIIAQFPVSGLNGVEFLVKSIDTPGTKYGVATVLAVTDGTNVDFSIYGQAFLGTTTGTLSVAISGANIALSTTPASSNSTVWTTQYRSI